MNFPNIIYNAVLLRRILIYSMALLAQLLLSYFIEILPLQKKCLQLQNNCHHLHSSLLGLEKSNYTLKNRLHQAQSLQKTIRLSSTRDCCDMVLIKIIKNSSCIFGAIRKYGGSFQLNGRGEYEPFLALLKKFQTNNINFKNIIIKKTALDDLPLLYLQVHTNEI